MIPTSTRPTSGFAMTMSASRSLSGGGLTIRVTEPSARRSLSGGGEDDDGHGPIRVGGWRGRGGTGGEGGPPGDEESQEVTRHGGLLARTWIRIAGGVRYRADTPGAGREAAPSTSNPIVWLRLQSTVRVNTVYCTYQHFPLICSKTYLHWTSRHIVARWHPDYATDSLPRHPGNPGVGNTENRWCCGLRLRLWSRSQRIEEGLTWCLVWQMVPKLEVGPFLRSSSERKYRLTALDA